MLQSGEQPEWMELPEEEKLAYFSEIDAELQIAAETVVQSQNQLEVMKQQLSKSQNLETELREKHTEISLLRIQLNQSLDLQALSNKAASEAWNDVEQLRSKLELVERSNTEISADNVSLQTEVNLKDEELNNAREELNTAREIASDLTNKVEKLQDAVTKSNVRELNLEVEIATLKSEIHKGRARAAAAEMANISVMSSRAGLYRAVEELAIEAEAAKSKERMLTLKLKDNSSSEIFEEVSEKNGLISDASPPPVKEEAEILKEKLEAANAEINTLRSNVEEAVRRAKAAETANEEIKEQARRSIERREQRKLAASEGHPQQSGRRLNGSSTTKFDKPPRVHHEPQRAKSLELGLSGHKEKSNSGYYDKYPGYVPLYRYLNIKIKSIDMK